ncbi:MAG: hydrolase [bacterium]|nr:hydrolase [bacterium]
MQFVTYNIHYGFGRDGHNALERIAEAVDGADVIALQEVERFWPRSGMADQVARLSKLLPDYWIAYGPNLDLHSPAGFPGEAHTARRQFGNMVLSRTPIHSTTNVSLPRPSDEPQTMQRGALDVVLSTSIGAALRVYSTHLDYLSPLTRLAQLQAIETHHARSIDEGGAWVGVHASEHDWIVGDEPKTPNAAVLLGDLNMWPGTSEYRAALHPESPFSDAWDHAITRGQGATKDGHRIDHCWVTHDLVEHVGIAWVDPEADGSDHQPIWFELDI